MYSMCKTVCRYSKNNARTMQKNARAKQEQCKNRDNARTLQTQTAGHARTCGSPSQTPLRHKPQCAHMRDLDQS